MTTSVAIFGWIFLGLVTAVSLEPSDYRDDDWWTSSGNVLAGTDTPVYFFRSDNNSAVGYTLSLQKNAMADLKKQSGPFSKPVANGTDINNEWSDPEEWFEKLKFRINCVAPDIIYPKIVVIVDHDIYLRYKKKLTNLLEYVMAVWNGVDLNFRDVNHPKVRLHIAGIIVADVEELPFLSQRREKNGKLPIYTAMISFARFMEKNGSTWSAHFGSYHVAVVMTSVNIDRLGSRISKASHHSRTMCTYMDAKGPPSRVLLSDNGCWSRITRDLTWEFGNSLYSSRPGIESEWCIGVKSVVTSFYDNNYYDNMTLWSKCSLDSLKKRLNTKEANCLHDKPKLTSPLPRVLPGKIMCHGTCKAVAGSICCPQQKADTCQYISCAEVNRQNRKILQGRCKSYRINAPDGTPCGGGKICFRRKCMFEKEIK